MRLASAFASLLCLGCAFGACSDERDGGVPDVQRAGSPAASDGGTALEGGPRAGSGPGRTDRDGSLPDAGDVASDGGEDAACPAVELDRSEPFEDARALHPVALEPHAFFRIEVVESGTGTPLAGALLTTTN